MQSQCNLSNLIVFASQKFKWPQRLKRADVRLFPFRFQVTITINWTNARVVLMSYNIH